MYYKRIRSLNNKTNESESNALVELIQKRVPKICRVPTGSKESSTGDDSKRVKQVPDKKSSTGDDSKQVKQPDEASSQTVKGSGDNSQVGKLEESHPRFGPLYSVYQPSVQAIKEKSWNHVITYARTKHSQLEQDQVEDTYLRAMAKVETQAKEAYADNKAVSGMGSDFRRMMIRDGCFFLQLALLILGCSDQLGYASNDPIFGRKHHKKDLNKWIEAMFYVGNQIPFVVLRKLMKQEFFQDVISKKNWRHPPPSGWCREVLYELLVLPSFKTSNTHCLSMGRRGGDEHPHPCDLLHGVHNKVMGAPAPAARARLSGEYEEDAEDNADLEASYEEEIILFPDDSTKLDHDDGRKRIFPSATDLKRAGIRIRKLESGGGARSIRFKSYYFFAFLYLPRLQVDDSTETMFRSLRAYEACPGRQRGVGSYLRVMSDIVRTTRDAKLMAKHGLVHGSPDDVEKLPRILSRLSCEDAGLTRELGVVGRMIRDYSSPWIHYKDVLNVVVFLTLLQTLFTVIAYFDPPNPKPSPSPKPMP